MTRIEGMNEASLSVAFIRIILIHSQRTSSWIVRVQSSLPAPPRWVSGVAHPYSRDNRPTERNAVNINVLVVDSFSWIAPTRGTEKPEMSTHQAMMKQTSTGSDSAHISEGSFAFSASTTTWELPPNKAVPLIVPSVILVLWRVFQRERERQCFVLQVAKTTVGKNYSGRLQQWVCKERQSLRSNDNDKSIELIVRTKFGNLNLVISHDRTLCGPTNFMSYHDWHRPLDSTITKWLYQ